MSDTPTTSKDTKRQWLSTVLGVKLPRAGGAVQPGDSNGAVSGKRGAPAGNAQVEAAPEAVPPPVAIGGGMSPVDMKEEDIAAEIMDKQVAILVGWHIALQVFDKTMTSSADAEASPDFQKVVVGYFADKLMGAIMKHAPGASELDAVVKGLDGEYQRAAAAGESAKLRDFVIQHAKAIGKLHQRILSERQGFISAVRARREAVEAPKPVKSGRKSGKWGPAEPTREENDLAMMRMALMDTLENVDKALSVSNSETLFRVLSEEWIRNAKVRGGMGTRFPAVVVIRLNPNYTVKDAHIQGSGGQKLAEQLLKDAGPQGVDVFRLQAPRRILLMAENGWPSAILSLDANNRDISTGSIAEGDTESLKKYVMSKGLPPTKKLTGD